MVNFMLPFPESHLPRALRSSSTIKSMNMPNLLRMSSMMKFSTICDEVEAPGSHTEGGRLGKQFKKRAYDAQCSEIGASMLRKCGHAVDAAVATVKTTNMQHVLIISVLKSSGMKYLMEYFMKQAVKRPWDEDPYVHQRLNKSWMVNIKCGDAPELIIKLMGKDNLVPMTSSVKPQGDVPPTSYNIVKDGEFKGQIRVGLTFTAEIPQKNAQKIPVFIYNLAMIQGYAAVQIDEAILDHRLMETFAKKSKHTLRSTICYDALRFVKPDSMVSNRAKGRDGGVVTGNFDERIPNLGIGRATDEDMCEEDRAHNAEY
ncbi:Elicitor-responsive protein 3-like protein, partial [Drosera capensis]